MISFLPETFGPILLSCRACKMRRRDPSLLTVRQYDLEKTDVSQLLTVVIARPLHMLVFEPIVSATCAYLALLSAILYVSFEAFPIIVQQLYCLSPGVTGLCYMPIGGGAILSLAIIRFWDTVLAKAHERGALWTKREEYRRVPLACIGGPVFAISPFWLGFSA